MSNETVGRPDFETLFGALPGLYLVLDPDFRIVAASDAYLQATSTRRADILGRYLFDVFSENTDDPSADAINHTRASLHRVLQNHVADAMVVQRHDVRRPESDGGGFEVRYWSPINSPVLNPDGTLAYIIHRVENVTEFVLLQQQSAQRAALTAAQGELKEANEGLAIALATQTAELQAVLDAAPVAVWIAHDTQCLRITGNAYADRIVMRTGRGGNVSRSAPPGEEAVSYKVFRNGVDLRPEELPAQVAAATGLPVKEGEYELVFRDGRTVHMLMGAVPLHDAGGRVRGSVAAGVNITERKQAEEALRASEARLRLTLDGTGLGTFEYRPETRESLWDAGAKAAWGLSADAEITYPKVIDRIHPEDRSRIRAAMEAALRPGSPEYSQSEYRVIWPDGSIHWILGRSRTLFDGEGEQRRATRMMGVHQDITELKRAEEALRESEAHYRTLSETMLQGVVYQDADGKILSMNPAAETILGKTQAEFLGSTSVSVDHDSVREDGSHFPGLEHPAMVALATGREVRAVRMGVYNPRAKQRRWIEVNAVPLFRSGEEKPYQVYTIFEDVTQRKIAEEALRASEARFAFVLEAAQLGAWDLDLARHTAWRSGRHDQVFGYPELLPEWTYEMFLDHVLAEDREEVDRKFQHAQTSGTDWEFECRIRRADGAIRWIWAHGRSERNADGAPIRMSGVMQDVTARKQSEEALAASEGRFRALLDSASQGVVAVDETGRMVLVNAKTEEMFGYTRDELLGQPLGFLLPERYRTGHSEHLVEYFSRPYARVMGLGMDLSGRSKSGNEFPLEVSLSCIEEGGASLAMALITDITERKKAEERLRQAQKLESLGLLAGGGAHDFNNLLVGVIGNASLIGEMLTPDHPASELLDGVLKAGEQAAHLTRQMLAYSGRGKFLVELLDLSKLIPDLCGLVRPSIPKKITLQLDLKDDLPPIEADRGQVQQVFMNLALNAAEAIGSQGGLISIRNGVQIVDDQYMRLHPDAAGLPPGDYVFLEVRDTGCGMDEATRARVFDPFFSTKFTGRGLGLAAVAGIVRGHKSAITVSSAPGQGSCFTVLFPAAAHGAAERRVNPASIPLQGSGAVLVVDDEEVVRDLAKRVLERHGYSVLLANSGAAAIDVFKRHPGAIALVVLDLSMPHMSGEETLRELRRIRPEAKVVVSSGYTEAETMTMFKGQRVAGFIQKPYTMTGLAEKVKLYAG